MASMNDKDYYAILGVSETASVEEIRKAFQVKARKLHPDVNKEPDAEERFKEVSEAYAVLSDADKRKRYDAMRSGVPFAYGSGSSPSGTGGYGYGSDPFAGADPFGFNWNFTRSSATRRSRAYNPKAGADVVYEMDLTADEVKSGCKRGVTYQRYDTCSSCSGTGSVHTEQSKTCPTCGGSGHLTVDTGLFGVMNMACPECEGTGRVVADPCSSCGGSGRVLTASEVVIEVPAGVHDGQTIRIPGKGNAGTNGSSTGDFVCRVGVPAERLSGRQAMGFQLLGFALPFIIAGIVFNMMSSVLFTVSIPLIMGLILVVMGGPPRFNAQWMRSALNAVINGSSTGVVFAILLVLMVQCSTGLGRGYVQTGWR